MTSMQSMQKTALGRQPFQDADKQSLETAQPKDNGVSKALGPHNAPLHCHGCMHDLMHM